MMLSVNIVDFNYSNMDRKDGTKVKLKSFLHNPKSELFAQQLTLKSKACNKLEL